MESETISLRSPVAPDTDFDAHGVDEALPEFHNEAKNEANLTAGDEPVSNSSGESSDGRHDHAAVGEDDFLEKTKPGLLEPRPLEPLSQHCGELPTGSSVEYFHEPPRIIHARNLEGRYLDDFHSQVHEAFAPNMTLPASVDSLQAWNIHEAEARLAAKRQQLFFKSVDKFRINLDQVGSTKTSRKSDFDQLLESSIQSLNTSYKPSDTVVMEAAFYLLEQGLLNIQDVGSINVKQARAFLWNAAWLQDHMSFEWRANGALLSAAMHPRRFEQFSLAIIGPGGTGKTAVLKITEALTQFFLGPDHVRKLAPSNPAARLFGGDTLHALCKLPFGNTRLATKRGRLAAQALREHRKVWENAVAVYMDEVSMISSGQFLQCDVRLRQAKMQPNVRFGGMALNVCGDFLQLPPVDKDRTRRSLAEPFEDDSAIEDGSDTDKKKRKHKKAKLVEGQQGFDLWRAIRFVVCLNVNVRAPGVLSRLQAEMRAGDISDEMWDLYLSRVMAPNDARFIDPKSPFMQYDTYFIVHRHRIRVLRSLENAKAQSKIRSLPLYVIQAHDEPVSPQDMDKITPNVREELLRRVKPELTKGLPSFLPLYVGMRLILSSKDCVRFGRVKGCTCILRHIVFADHENLPVTRRWGASSFDFYADQLGLASRGCYVDVAFRRVACFSARFS